MVVVMPLSDVSNLPASRLMKPKFFRQVSENTDSTPSTRPSNLSRREVSPEGTKGISRKEPSTPTAPKSPLPKRETRQSAPYGSGSEPPFAPRPRSRASTPQPTAQTRNASPTGRGQMPKTSSSRVASASSRVPASASRASASTPSKVTHASASSRTTAEEIATLKARGEQAREEADRALDLKKELQAKIHALQQLEKDSLDACVAAGQDYAKKDEEFQEARPQWEKHLEDGERKRVANARRKSELRIALEKELETSAALEKTKSQRLVLISREEKRAKELKLEAEKENADEVKILEQLEEQNKTIDGYLNLCKQLEQVRGEQVLRQMYYFNEYMEAKGNIRVFVRMRPPDDKEQSCITVEDNTMSLYSTTYKTVDGLRDQTARWQFAFDKIFAEDCSQQSVFDEISLLVQSALDGFKVAIFAYGQTGSGKTYTMEGPYVEKRSSRMHLESAGMIPRALRLIFEHIEKLADTGWNYNLSVSYVEIYNEVVRDLLGKEVVEIKHDHGETTMNCKVVDVLHEKQILSLLAKASEARATASTLTNDRSSRSHIVFQLRINATGPKNTELRGLLSLVDLAGSERVEKSQAVGDRLKEAQAINKSLSALGDVIQSLAENASHVPYRNSKLTMLLRDSLGGDSKTLMFANICPSQQNLQESVNTLRFASKVNTVCNSKKKRKMRNGGT